MQRFLYPVPCNAGEGGSAGGVSGNAGGAGGGAGAATGGAAGSGGTPSWYSTFAEENRGYAEVKGWKSPEDVVTSYRNAEKMLGAPKEKLIRLPDKEDAPEWNDIFNRLGRPEKADGYKVEIPEKVGDAQFAEWAQKLFHEAGLSRKQGERIASEWNKKALEAVQAQEQAEIDESNQQLEKLKQEWGQAFEPKVRAKNELLKLAGVTDEQHLELEKALGVDGLAKFVDTVISKFGIKLGEHQFHGGGGGNNFDVLTPAGAQAKKDALLGDKDYRQRYLNGGHAEQAEIRKLEETIWKAKYPNG